MAKFLIVAFDAGDDGLAGAETLASDRYDIHDVNHNRPK